VLIRENTITNNNCTDTDCAVVTIFEPEVGDPIFELRDNDLSGNSADFTVLSTRTVGRSIIDATGNDWGATDCETIDALIYDFFDASSLTIVNYGEDVCDDEPVESPPCPGGTADISSPADVITYAGCTELDGVSLHMVSGVVNVTLPNLQTVHGSVYFHQTVNVQTVSFPLLEGVEGYVYFHDNDRLETVDLPSLESVGEYLYFNGNDVLETVDLTEALTAVDDYISITGSPLLCLPELDWDSISGSVSISGTAECDGSAVEE
jgi:hypothetical protein